MIALKILDMLLRLYMLIVLAVVIIRVLQVTPNKWTNLLDRMTEPLLSPIRAQLNKHLPEAGTRLTCRRWCCCCWCGWCARFCYEGGRGRANRASASAGRTACGET